jgi:heat shock protein HslJ
VALLLAGCSSPDPGTDPARLEGVTWILDAASAGSLVDHVPKGARVDLQFQEGQASGKSGCNTYGGSYEAGDGTLSFGQMQMTLIACDQQIMALESAYLDALGATTGFQITNSGLVLTGGQVALTFTTG